MDHETEQEEIRPLIFNYVFHVILYVLIFVMHLIMYNKVFWIFSSLSILYLIGSYLNILYLIFPVYPLILIILKKYKKRIIQSLKKITLILLIITITFGLMASIAILVNSINSKVFCRECPFNLGLTHLNAVFGDYYNTVPDEDEIKYQCTSRRCVLDREEPDEKYPFIYLCNYDPTEEFDFDDTYKRQFQNGTEVTTNIQLKCQSVTAYYEMINFKNSEMRSYLNLCYYLADFYVCQRFNKPEKYYNLDLELSCPETNYILLIFIFSVLIIIIDVVISLLPWGVEYMSLKRIIIVLSESRRKVNSVNSTARSSQISNDDGSFKKDKTPVLIVPSFGEININNINNINNDDRNKDILQLKQSILRESKIALNNTQENERNINIIRPINNKQIQNSERKKINNRDVEIDIESEKEDKKDNEFPNRNRVNTKNNENTTLYTHQINQINIKLDNEDA